MELCRDINKPLVSNSKTGMIAMYTWLCVYVLIQQTIRSAVIQVTNEEAEKNGMIPIEDSWGLHGGGGFWPVSGG